MSIQIPKTIEQQQDEILDQMGSSLDRLKGMSHAIKTEVVIQEPILEKLGEDVDLGNERAKRATQDIQVQINRSSSKGGVLGGLGLILAGLISILVFKPKF